MPILIEKWCEISVNALNSFVFAKRLVERRFKRQFDASFFAAFNFDVI